MVKGKTIHQVEEIKNTEIVEELNLPPVKIHCSVLAEDAIKSAVKDYIDKQPREAEFDFVFDINNFKFKPADSYEFGIDKKQVALIKAGNTDYWVALDKTTTFKES